MLPFCFGITFYIDEKLANFIKQYKEKLNLVSKERINYEIQKIVRGANALEAILSIRN